MVYLVSRCTVDIVDCSRVFPCVIKIQRLYRRFNRVNNRSLSIDEATSLITSDISVPIL